MLFIVTWPLFPLVVGEPLTALHGGYDLPWNRYSVLPPENASCPLANRFRIGREGRSDPSGHILKALRRDLHVLSDVAWSMDQEAG